MLKYLNFQNQTNNFQNKSKDLDKIATQLERKQLLINQF
jgi:hypothetical protein